MGGLCKVVPLRVDCRAQKKIPKVECLPKNNELLFCGIFAKKYRDCLWLEREMSCSFALRMVRWYQRG